MDYLGSFQYCNAYCALHQVVAEASFVCVIGAKSHPEHGPDVRAASPGPEPMRTLKHIIRVGVKELIRGNFGKTVLPLSVDI